MAKIEMKGLDEYTRALSRLSGDMKDKVIGPAIYEAAGIVADAVNASISSIPTYDGWGTPEHPAAGINAKAKAALHNGLGIAPMRSNAGVYHVKIGFDGYNDIRTGTWPNGQPNAMIARSVERGTSFLKETPFIKKAVASVRTKALDRMRLVVDRKIRAIMDNEKDSTW